MVAYMYIKKFNALKNISFQDFLFFFFCIFLFHCLFYFQNFLWAHVLWDMMNIVICDMADILKNTTLLKNTKIPKFEFIFYSIIFKFFFLSSEIVWKFFFVSIVNVIVWSFLSVHHPRDFIIFNILKNIPKKKIAIFYNSKKIFFFLLFNFFLYEFEFVHIV